MTFLPRVTTCALIVSSLFSAAAASDEYHRQHDAHQHGIVEFNIAQDGQDLLLEITAPGADVVGFEHPPTSEQQQQAVERAIEELKQATELFAFTASAKCQLTEAFITENLITHDSHAGHDHEEHDHDSHHEHATHGGFSAQYAFHCADIKQLKDLQVSWFKHFPSTEKIAIQAITETSQKAEQLTPTSTLFKF
ncbi:zinc uptake protein ZrgA [Photobacterium lipolyticum]|uniref:DUF2796 domain-containing protein n=1 Tax=Photobacterium lipolyticum TaxID=266810 RepID=A0A2T3MSN7_9GAMM|nr:DUF2796 domain-containing protein [Photobacterium lipolyticum]PSW00892.1 DUF2796 domain-containing protein [Photobacterium lipolyticum]